MEPIGGLWGEGIGVRLAVVARWRGGEVVSVSVLLNAFESWFVVELREVELGD